MAGASNVIEGQPVTGAEDFGFYAEQVPAMFVFLGVRPKGSPLSTFVSNHSPRFFADESALPTGVRTLVMNGIDGAWLDDDEKRRMRSVFERELDELDSQLDTSATR